MPDRIFVYGTLRKGGGLSNMWPSGASFAEATMPGVLYEHTGGGYPVMVPLVGQSETLVVTGDLVTVSSLHEIEHIVTMEVQAGYNLQHALCKNAAGNEVRCLVFAWPWSDIGPVVKGGDWLDYIGAPAEEGGTEWIDCHGTEWIDCQACGESVRITEVDDFGTGWGIICRDCQNWEYTVWANERDREERRAIEAGTPQE